MEELLKIKIRSSLILASILVWPTFIIFPSSLNKQFTLLLLIITGIFWINKSKIKFGFVEFLLALNMSYVLINTIVHLTSYRDFGDAIKTLGVFVFFVLGKNSMFFLEQKHLKRINYLLLGLVISFLLKETSVFPIDFSSFIYSDFGRRFFGFSNSPNYLWINVFVLSSFVLTNRQTTPNYIFYIFLYALVLLLTGSRTTLILSFIFILILQLKKISLRNTIVIVLIILILSQLYLYLSVDNFYVKRIAGLIDAIFALDLNQIYSFNARINVWEEVFSKFSFFGNGPEKTGFSIFDNSYITTIIRFGYLGLFIELLPVIYLLFQHTDKKNKIFQLTLIITFLIAGIPSSIFYNLKAPYLFYFTMGAMLKKKYD